MNILNVMSNNSSKHIVKQNGEAQVGFDKVLSALGEANIPKEDLSNLGTEVNSSINGLLRDSENKRELKDNLLSKLISSSEDEDKEVDLLVSQLINSLLGNDSVGKSDTEIDSSKIIVKPNEKSILSNYSEMKSDISDLSNLENLEKILDNIMISTQNVNTKNISHGSDAEINISEIDVEAKVKNILNIIGKIESETSNTDNMENIKHVFSDIKKYLNDYTSENKDNFNPKMLLNQLEEVRKGKNIKNLNHSSNNLLKDQEGSLNISKNSSIETSKLDTSMQEASEYLYIDNKGLDTSISKEDHSVKALSDLVEEIANYEKGETKDLNAISNSLKEVDKLSKIEQSEIKDKIIKYLNNKVDNDNLQNKDRSLVNEKKILKVVDQLKLIEKQDGESIAGSNDKLLNSFSEILDIEPKSNQKISDSDKLSDKAKISDNTEKILINVEKTSENTFKTIATKPIDTVQQEQKNLSGVEKGDVVKQVIENIDYEKNSFSENIKIQLKPKELGKLELEVTRKDGKFEASIIVETDEAKAIIKNKSSQLVAAFERKDMQLSELKMIVRKSNTSNANFNFSRDNGESNPQHQSQYLNKYSSIMNNIQDSDKDLVDSNLQNASNNYKYYGNSVNIFV